MSCLTKDECLSAVDEIYNDLCELEVHRTLTECTVLYNENLETLKDLIGEHFDNPPLEFKDLESDMVVFDKSLDEWIQIGTIIGENDFNHTVPYYRFGDEELYTDKFEESRFYRK